MLQSPMILVYHKIVIYISFLFSFLMCQSANNQSTLHYHRSVVFQQCSLGCYAVPFPHMVRFCGLLQCLAGRMWCHCRMVYLPMCYIYGKRFVGRITPLLLELRKELFKDPYNKIDWDKARNLCAKVCQLFCVTFLMGIDTFIRMGQIVHNFIA